MQEQKESYEESVVILESKIKATTFNSKEDALKAYLPKPQIDAIQLEIENWNNSYNDINSRIKEIKNSINTEDYKITKEIIYDIENATKDLLTKSNINISEMQKNAIQISDLEKNKSQFESLNKELEEVSTKSIPYIKLSEALNGDTPSKIKFDSWILSLYPNEITNYASQRLSKISKGRYIMSLADGSDNTKSTDSSANKGYKGLDIEITDLFTGITRPTASLSGGETFMASLSLALALSDVVQNNNGGVQLDSLFIDEGFGSLDDQALEVFNDSLT